MNVNTSRNLSIFSDLPSSLVESVCAGMWADEIEKLMLNILSYGFEPKRLDMFRQSGTVVRIEVFPAKNQLGSYTHLYTDIHVCQECTSIYKNLGEHPENGCKVGVVEAVMAV